MEYAHCSRSRELSRTPNPPVKTGLDTSSDDHPSLRLRPRTASCVNNAVCVLLIYNNNNDTITRVLAQWEGREERISSVFVII